MKKYPKELILKDGLPQNEKFISYYNRDGDEWFDSTLQTSKIMEEKAKTVEIFAGCVGPIPYSLEEVSL